MHLPIAMHSELDAATNGICRLFQRDVPSSAINIFKKALRAALEERIKKYWYTDQPQRAQALRCVTHNPRRTDKAITAACQAAQVEISHRSPSHFVVYIDPHDVCVRLGDTLVPLSSESTNYDALETTLAETRTTSPSSLLLTSSSTLSTPDSSPRLSAGSPKFSQRSKQPLAIIDPITLQASA
eukprot:TRINITY_DN10163_c0_g2_i1.p1 TRINITY_DN10163_c0_g2~~TRINITY_DN10163_c0_g2_i1.p1  ORF type:complete len:184 (+),score=27.63 TRINITY_DN10163_c0_g2_i1:240-791(+)